FRRRCQHSGTGTADGMVRCPGRGRSWSWPAAATSRPTSNRGADVDLVLDRLADDYLAETLTADPFAATMAGVPGYDGEVPDPPREAGLAGARGAGRRPRG